MLEVPKTFLGWKIFAPSERILIANIQIRVIALRFEIVEKNAALLDRGPKLEVEETAQPRKKSSRKLI